MPVTYTPSPSSALPGEVVGPPVRLPCILVCNAGDGTRICGKVWTANTRQQFAEMAAAKRRHEERCGGGLIVVSQR